LRLLLDSETVLAMAAGVVFAAPTLPWLLERLRAPRLAASAVLEPRLDTRGVHVLANPVLLAGLTLSVAHLAGSSLNPFLYFRF
jgi:alginate O-acetyltransferase complex protein AlgI